MSMDGQGTNCRIQIAEIYNRLTRVHERYRQTDDRRQTNGRQHIANVNMSSRLLKTGTRHPVEDYFGNEFLSIYNHCGVMAV